MGYQLRSSYVQLFFDGDTQVADSQRFWGTITSRGPQVEVGPHLPEVGMEGVQMAVALRVIEGQLALLTLQLHTQTPRHGLDQRGCGGVRSHAVVSIHTLCAAQVPEA